MTFLEDQYFGGRFPSMTVSIVDLTQAMGERAPISGLDFIFHSSMALSTMAARLFDIDGVSMGMKEPIILNQLAELARRGCLDTKLVELILQLLARPIGAGERVIVKAGNVANRIIPELMTIASSARALFLYAPLDDFLRSIAKKGLAGRIAYRRLFLLLRKDFGVDGGFDQHELFEQTDLQVAALAWLNHHAQFAQLLPQLGTRGRSLSSRAFLADRTATVDHMVRFLGLRVDPTGLAASSVFAEHSKELGRSYDAAARARDYAAVDTAYGEEIAMVARWGTAVAEHIHVPISLPSPLAPK